ncbi:MAG: hypothetical protein WCF79_13665 [Rhodomicrobium sp.]
MKRATEEIGRRRLAWFYTAALVFRATKISERNASCRAEAAEIWKSLLAASKNLKQICGQTGLWGQDEKIWFAELKNERDGQMYTYWCLVPNWLRGKIEIPRGLVGMEHVGNLHIEKLPDGVYLATSDDVQSLVAQGWTVKETIEIARDIVGILIEAQRRDSVQTSLASPTVL